MTGKPHYDIQPEPDEAGRFKRTRLTFIDVHRDVIEPERALSDEELYFGRDPEAVLRERQADDDGHLGRFVDITWAINQATGVGTYPHRGVTDPRPS